MSASWATRTPTSTADLPQTMVGRRRGIVLSLSPVSFMTSICLSVYHGDDLSLPSGAKTMMFSKMATMILLLVWDDGDCSNALVVVFCTFVVCVPIAAASCCYCPAPFVLYHTQSYVA